jgi:hypothetical protein
MAEQKHQVILDLIQQASFLAPNEKEFLASKLEEIKPLDRLKVQKDLQAGVRPELLQSLMIIRNQFIKQEAPKKPDFISKIVQAINPPKPKRILSPSILNNRFYLGSNPLQFAQSQKTEVKSLESIENLSQLNSLLPQHIVFEINENGDQKILSFFQKIDDLFSSIHDISQKRSYFMLYLQSPLYAAYMDTGLTALRHPEITPANVILNRLQQIDQKYLNSRQFQIATKITNHIRTMVGI